MIKFGDDSVLYRKRFLLRSSLRMLLIHNASTFITDIQLICICYVVSGMESLARAVHLSIQQHQI